MLKIEENFSGDYDVLRVIFSTSNPIETLYNLKHKYSIRLYQEYLEYLDVHEELKAIAKSEAENEKSGKSTNRR